MLQEHYYDRNIHNFKPLNVKEQSYFSKDLKKPLVTTKIIRKCNKPRSYRVQLENSREIERNRKHIFGSINHNKIKSEIVDNEQININDSGKEINVNKDINVPESNANNSTIPNDNNNDNSIEISLGQNDVRFNANDSVSQNSNNQNSNLEKYS